MRHGHIGDAFFDLDAAAFLCSQLPNVQPAPEAAAAAHARPIATPKTAATATPQVARPATEDMVSSQQAPAECDASLQQSSLNTAPAAPSHRQTQFVDQAQQATSQTHTAQQDSSHGISSLANGDPELPRYKSDDRHQLQQQQHSMWHEPQSNGIYHGDEHQRSADNMQHLPQRNQARRRGRSRQQTAEHQAAEAVQFSNGQQQLTGHSGGQPYTCSEEDERQLSSCSEEAQCQLSTCSEEAQCQLSTCGEEAERQPSTCSEEAQTHKTHIKTTIVSKPAIAQGFCAFAADQGCHSFAPVPRCCCPHHVSLPFPVWCTSLK